MSARKFRSNVFDIGIYQLALVERFPRSQCLQFAMLDARRVAAYARDQVRSGFRPAKCSDLRIVREVPIRNAKPTGVCRHGFYYWTCTDQACRAGEAVS